MWVKSGDMERELSEAQKKSLIQPNVIKKLIKKRKGNRSEIFVKHSPRSYLWLSVTFRFPIHTKKNHPMHTHKKKIPRRVLKTLGVPSEKFPGIKEVFSRNVRDCLFGGREVQKGWTFINDLLSNNLSN